jgi:hypothetical protein
MYWQNSAGFAGGWLGGGPGVNTLCAQACARAAFVLAAFARAAPQNQTDDE